MNVKIDDDFPPGDAIVLVSLAKILKNKRDYPHALEVIQAAKQFLMIYPTATGPFKVKKGKSN
ncbi:TPA: hypothetical protein DEP94_00105 [Candidatus Nomurabacteria bacterium]|nr:hypothetical protein [Candidatus Nomurabacteria bacterium]